MSLVQSRLQLLSRANKSILITKNIRFTPRLVTTTYRSFHDTPNKHNTTMVNTPPSASTLKQHSKDSVPFVKPTNHAEHLKDFNNKELISFMMMGLCTLNKPTLNLCIKLFPYIPMFIIKQLVYRIYCGGETIDQVKMAGLRLHERGINNMMISLTIEACDGNDNIDPEFIVDETAKSVKEILVPHTIKMIEMAKDVNDIPPGYVALKPTGFAKNAANVLRNYKSDPECAKQFEDLVSKASIVCQAVYDANIELSKKYPNRVAPFVVGVVDAEKHELQEGVYELQRRLYSKFNHLNQPVSVVGTLQMYLSESAQLLAKEEKLAIENKYRLGLKLVRGAYIHSEKNRGVVIHKTKQDTDENYNQGISYCIDSILSNAGNESTVGHLVVASHNGDSLRLASSKVYNEVNESNKNKTNVVLGQLLGMADETTYDLINHHGIGNVIKYVPWGPPVETKEYLRRRLEENGDAVKTDNGWPLVKAVAQVLLAKMFGRA
ncbi:PUT1 [[Candida] subhashii]|uniref:Proline dehydrogenase n=1 Tax=[Candida] subhashii TaxID=561895 RepID=A0A8J5QG00_9ASCO|nr:PUT1 [[Candida] subhashii]KAG7660877.1 PUT1 [[Candida] subhashii]